VNNEELMIVYEARKGLESEVMNNAQHSYPLKKFISRERAILKKKEDPKQSTVLLARVLEIRHEDSTAMSYPPRLNGAEVFRSAW